MKKIMFGCALALLVACKNETQDTAKPEENLTEVVDGVYKEYYPGRKKIKFIGAQDQNKQRNGKWTFYSENGEELSVTIYEHGKKEGFSVVKYPNGAIRYRGEYLHDQPVGIWTVYDQQGKVISEKDYGYQNK